MKRRQQHLPVISPHGRLTKQTSRSNRTRQSNTRILVISILIIISIGFIGWQYKMETEETVKNLILTIDELESEIRGKNENQSEAALRINQLEEEIQGKNVEEHEAVMRYNSLISSKEMVQKEKEQLESEITAQEKKLLEMDNANILTDALKDVSKRSVLEKFGEPPYRIEFQLEFPPDDAPPGTADRFVIEMAPLDLMPYAVYFFLQQISHKLYNGCSFHRNAPHVIQGGPVAYFANKDANLHTPFEEANLNNVAYQEYHPEFPHLKYTLGYAGRPGGPDFYVSLKNNTEPHGPGGQAGYEKKHEADPCFAKVIEGFDAVDRIHAMGVEEGGYRRLKEYVGIKEARIMTRAIV